MTNTVNSGTGGDSFLSAEEKAMKTIANKDAKDWTLDEQKAAATTSRRTARPRSYTPRRR
ncbi:MAG: hypothetical protein ACLU37_10405 [Collinsella sp.]